jgi:hypothetical protein
MAEERPSVELNSWNQFLVIGELQPTGLSAALSVLDDIRSILRLR